MTERHPRLRTETHFGVQARTMKIHNPPPPPFRKGGGFETYFLSHK